MDPSEGHIASSRMANPAKVYVVQSAKHAPFREMPSAFATRLFEALDEISSEQERKQEAAQSCHEHS